MASSCQATDARWDFFQAVNNRCVKSMDVVSNVFEDVKKESVDSIKNELKKICG